MIILDTHIWVKWIIWGESSIPSSIIQAMMTNRRVAVSSISCFEVALLEKQGKLELPVPVEEWFVEALFGSGIESLPIDCDIAQASVSLSDIHKDPADRLIIATAMSYEALLASQDEKFPKYPEILGNLLY